MALLQRLSRSLTTTGTPNIAKLLLFPSIEQPVKIKGLTKHNQIKSLIFVMNTFSKAMDNSTHCHQTSGDSHTCTDDGPQPAGEPKLMALHRRLFRSLTTIGSRPETAAQRALADMPADRKSSSHCIASGACASECIAAAWDRIWAITAAAAPPSEWPYTRQDQRDCLGFIDEWLSRYSDLGEIITCGFGIGMFSIREYTFTYIMVKYLACWASLYIWAFAYAIVWVQEMILGLVCDKLGEKKHDFIVSDCICYC